MNRTIITSLGDFQLALDQLLHQCTRKLLIFTGDGTELGLERQDRLDALHRLLQGSSESHCLRMSLRVSEPIRKHHPRFMRLLAQYAHRISVRCDGEGLSNLRETLIITDDRHALVRFDQAQARSKLLLDAPEEISVYSQRFEEIWRVSENELTSTTLGL